LVEDNHVNQVVAQSLLDGIGLSTALACDGKEALKVLESSPEELPFHLVLMDCQMPEMDGFETTKRIRAGEAGDQVANVPIIAMTANAMKGDKERCLQSGMSDYLAKPINPEDLETALRKWSGDHQDLPEVITSIQSERSSSQTWDVNGALKRVRGKKDRLLTLISMFIDDMPARLEALQHLHQSDDIEGVEKMAHAIKGVAGNISAEVMMDAAAELEQAVRQGDLGDAEAQIKAINSAYEQAKLLLEEYRVNN
ncbi:MAG: response regulator, partial [Pseudomonadales bacterium]|nr:response regulator [Pseudomonadales bacterium]